MLLVFKGGSQETCHFMFWASFIGGQIFNGGLGALLKHTLVSQTGALQNRGFCIGVHEDLFKWHPQKQELHLHAQRKLGTVEGHNNNNNSNNHNAHNKCYYCFSFCSFIYIYKHMKTKKQHTHIHTKHKNEARPARVPPRRTPRPPENSPSPSASARVW